MGAMTRRSRRGTTPSVCHAPDAGGPSRAAVTSRSAGHLHWVAVPTYSYACRECEHRFDIQQAFSDRSLTACPACGGGLRKVYSSVGVVFKGSGFYRNDSRSSASSKDAATAGSTTSDGGGAPAKTSSDGASSKPATPVPATSSTGSSSSGSSSTGSASSAASS